MCVLKLYLPNGDASYKETCVPQKKVVTLPLCKRCKKTIFFKVRATIRGFGVNIKEDTHKKSVETDFESDPTTMYMNILTSELIYWRKL